MSIVAQILTGSVLLGASMIVHLSILILAVRILSKMGNTMSHTGSVRRWGILAGIALAAIIGAHTIEVWLWALSLLAFGALNDIGTAVYFSLVTYTTLGYGDLVLAPTFRILGALAAVTGLLAFGLSTALLVGLFSRMINEETTSK